MNALNYFGLMKDRVNVASFKQALLADDFGLVPLPQELWQERLAGATWLLCGLCRRYHSSLPR